MGFEYIKTQYNFRKMLTGIIRRRNAGRRKGALRACSLSRNPSKLTLHMDRCSPVFLSVTAVAEPMRVRASSAAAFDLE